LYVQVHADPAEFFTLSRDIVSFDHFARDGQIFCAGEIKLAFEDCALAASAKYLGFKLNRLSGIVFIVLCVQICLNLFVFCERWVLLRVLDKV